MDLNQKYGFIYVYLNKINKNIILDFLSKNSIEVDSEDIFEEKKSKNAFNSLKEVYLRKHDLLIVGALSELGKNPSDELEYFLKNKIDILILDIPVHQDIEILNNKEAYRQSIHSILEVLKSVSKETMSVGRPSLSKEDPKIIKFQEEYQKFKNGEYGNISVKEFWSKINISRSSYYLYLNIIKDKESVSNGRKGPKGQYTEEEFKELYLKFKAKEIDGIESTKDFINYLNMNEGNYHYHLRKLKKNRIL